MLRSRIGGVFVGSESAKRMQIRLRLYYLWNVENKKIYFNYWGYTFFAHFGSSVFWSPRIHSDKESGKRMKDPTEFASLQSPTELRHCKVRPNSPHRKIWPNSQHWKIRPNSQHCKVRPNCNTVNSYQIRHTIPTEFVTLQTPTEFGTQVRPNSQHSKLERIFLSHNFIPVSFLYISLFSTDFSKLSPNILTN